MKNCQVTRALTCPWTESKCTVFRNFPTANTHRRKVFFFFFVTTDFGVDFSLFYAILILSQDSHHDAKPILFVFCTIFSPDAWHSELQEYQAAQTGPGEQIQHRFVAVFSLEDSVALTTVQAFQHNSESSVDTKGCLCVCECVFLSASMCSSVFTEGIQTGT